MSRKLRIVVVGGVPESLERFRGPLLSRLVGMGHEVTALAGSERAIVTRRLHARGVRFGTYRLDRTGTGLGADIATCHDLRRRFLQLRPDLVLAYTAKPVVWGGIAAHLAGVPRFAALVTGLGQQFSTDTSRQRAIGWMLRRLYRLSLSKAEVVIFQNEDDRADFVRSGIVPFGRTVRVRGSGIDLASWRRQPVPEGPPRVLCVARLLAAKGVREFAAAARRLRELRPEIGFELIGIPETGHGALTLEEVAEWKREGLLEFHEWLDDIGSRLAAATVFVLPSYYGEGVPRTILEAMAIGRAVVTTDHVGCRDAVVHDKTGLLVPPRDPAALADAIESLVHDRARLERMSDAARSRAEALYDVEGVNDAIVESLALDEPPPKTAAPPTPRAVSPQPAAAREV